jgi:ketosteroid isomerase-like protein
MPKINKFLETVEETEAAFYDAISRADIEMLMSLWADDDDIVCVHPGSARVIGPAAIRATWEQIFAHGGVHIRPVQVHAVQNVMTSVHSVIEEVHHTGAKAKDLHVLATNVYMKTPMGWRIVMHHACVVPGEAPSDTPLANLLH